MRGSVRGTAQNAGENSQLRETPNESEIQNESERLVMVDPIMADGGKLYNGIGMERVAAMQRLVSYSDVMVPNMTEAGFLDGICPGREQASAAELRELVDGLHKLSGKSVVITSAQDSETGEHLVCGYDHKMNQYFRVPFTFLPVRVAGSRGYFFYRYDRKTVKWRESGDGGAGSGACADGTDSGKSESSG